MGCFLFLRQYVFKQCVQHFLFESRLCEKKSPESHRDVHVLMVLGEPGEIGGSVGRISGLLGLGGHFQSKFVRLLGLGYALRVKLPLFIFAGFAFSHLVINYIPRIVLELDFEEEEVSLAQSYFILTQDFNIQLFWHL